MKFLATLKPHTAVHKACRRHNRCSWAIHGVVFSYLPSSKTYKSGVLSPEQHEALKDEGIVQIEVLTAPPEKVQLPQAEAAPEPVKSVANKPKSLSRSDQ